MSTDNSIDETPDLSSAVMVSIDSMPDPVEPNDYSGPHEPADSQPYSESVHDHPGDGNASRQDTDASGVMFDPEQHAVDEHGEPKYRKDGNFAKKRGRKKGADSSGSTINNGGLGRKQEKRSQDAVHLLVGRSMTSAVITAGLVISDDFQPIRDPANGIDERAMLEQAFTEYAAAKEIEDFPPGVALAMALTMYVAPRLQKQKTQNRLAQFGNWAGSKFLIWKNRKSKKKAAKQAKREEAEKSDKQGDSEDK